MVLDHTELRVPKKKLVVELALGSEPTREMEVFISGLEAGDQQQREVLELLEQAEMFLPAHDRSAGAWVLFNKRALRWISLQRSGLRWGEPEGLELFERRFTVLVAFEDGSTLEGEMLFSPPAAGGRVGDHLNRPEPFFSLYQADRVFLVNKAKVVTVVEDQFPADRQAQIRQMVAESLRGVIAQNLCRKKGGGRVAAFEILIGSPAVSNLIRERKTFQLLSVMQTDRNQGMTTLGDSLLKLVRDDLVTPLEAYLRAADKETFKRQLLAQGFELPAEAAA